MTFPLLVVRGIYATAYRSGKKKSPGNSPAVPISPPAFSGDWFFGNKQRLHFNAQCPSDGAQRIGGEISPPPRFNVRPTLAVAVARGVDKTRVACRLLKGEPEPLANSFDFL